MSGGGGRARLSNVRSISGPGHLLFFRSLLQNPKAVGAVAPSSPRLSELMASRVDPASGPVLEVGAGTGAITRALLKRDLRPERLFIIERDRGLAAFLRNEFPGVRVHCGDAADAGRILWTYSVPCVRTVVSSLPLRNLSREDRMDSIRAMVNSLTHGGQIIQYTYGGGCPIPSRRFHLDAECLGRVWKNLPPAAVWRFVKRH